MMESPPEDLKWISADEKNLSDKIKSKGIFGLLVPLGCIVTVGILARGVYHLYRNDSKKQQAFMRYRILAQGITVGLATFGMFQSRIP